MSPTADPRVLPLPPHEWPEATRNILEADLGARSPLGAARMGDLNLFTTLARLPRCFEPWLLLGRALLMKGSLQFRDRELVILRVATRTRTSYEWGHHVEIALQGGIDRETIDRVLSGPAHPGWQPRERLLLSATDELQDGALIAEHTWAALKEHLDEQELIELPMLVGYYTLVAFLANSFAIAPEAQLEQLPG